jgi:molybdate transport system substrate-binding protein
MRTPIWICIIPVVAVSLGLARPAAAAGSLTVFGAASLTEFLQQAEQVFESEHPGTRLTLNLAASSRLRIQIEHGAPADVFLSANTLHMNGLVEAKLAQSPTVFAHNRLVIVLPQANPAHIDHPADLARPDLKLVIAAAETPIGRYTRISFDKMDASGEYGDDFKARAIANVRSNEPTVKAVVAKVLLGEADGGVCYASDVTAALRPKVKVVDIPDDVNVVADYPIALVAGSRNERLARQFIAFVLAPQGQRLLAHHGFIPARPTEAE